MSDVSDWWTTSIIDMEPGRRNSWAGYSGPYRSVVFAEMIWLMLRGDIPAKGQADLLEAALVASVDHGPQASSTSRQNGGNLWFGDEWGNGTAVHMLDDVHGGAGQQFVSMLQKLANQPKWDEPRLAEYLATYRQDINPFIPGFGHRFHKPVDPRSPCLMALVAKARNENIVAGKFMDIALQIETVLAAMKADPLGRDAAIIGKVVEDPQCFVQMQTVFGGSRVVDWLVGEQLPRIC